jgi:hypothetical protein
MMEESAKKLAKISKEIVTIRAEDTISFQPIPLEDIRSAQEWTANVSVRTPLIRFNGEDAPA